MRLRSVAASAAITVGCIAAGASSASAAGFVAGENCLEHQAFVDGDAAAVAARLPRKYSPVIDGTSGKPLVFARAMRCDRVSVGGRPRPAVLASIGVVIASPDGRGCSSGLPAIGPVVGPEPPLCNWYTLVWLSDNRRLVDWLKAGTRGVRAVFSRDLAFHAGTAFRFSAPRRYSIDDVAHQRPGQISVRGAYWTDTPRGTVKLALSTDDLAGGDANGTVRAPAHSEMATLMGATQRTYASAYAGFAAVAIGHGAYRKQLLWPARHTDSFEGSCSFQGDVGFAPGATNAQRQLTSTYDAGGTCTGKLNGRSLSNAHVGLREAGPVYASCLRAQTTAPWVGTLTFPGGTMVGYTLDFTSVATQVTGTTYGDRSGYADWHATFATSRTSPAVPAQCAGAGLHKAPMDLSFTTNTPLTSDRPRLNLSVRPRVVRTGHRTVFRFNAAQGTGIRFAGKHARAGRNGRAAIVTTLRRDGKWAAIGTKPGYVSARALVRARAPR